MADMGNSQGSSGDVNALKHREKNLKNRAHCGPVQRLARRTPEA
jgi:hypothetical protein